MDIEGFDDLIRRAQGGDREALERLLASMRPYVSKVATGYADPARASESVSDLMQEAELRVWRNLGQFRGGRADEETHAKFRTWLAQIVRHIAFDRAKAKRRQKRKAPGQPVKSLDALSLSSKESGLRSPDPASSGPSPSAGLRETEELLLLEQSMDRVLDPIDREIVHLHFFQQQSLPRIAEKLGWTYDRVRDHYRGAIRKLESHFENRKCE